MYPIGHINTVTGEVFEDRQHILYLNASYKGEDSLGQLMHDFLCSDPDDMYTEMMAKRASYLKSHPEGVKIMCNVIEDMREDVEQRTLLEAIKNIMESFKVSAQQAMDVLKIPAADQPKYLEKL